MTLTNKTKTKTVKKPKTELQKLQAKAKRDKHENRFLMLWKACGGPPLEREYRFAKDRKWRFDFAHPLSGVAIEVEGGTWSGGRHTRGSGYAADCEKYNEAAMSGWAVLRLTSEMITHEQVNRISCHIIRVEKIIKNALHEPTN